MLARYGRSPYPWRAFAVAWRVMDTASGPFWRGINHLALVTTDMDATVRFWHGVLGARLVAHLGTESFRHYFFEFGPQQTVAFFEYADVPLGRFQVPAGVPDQRKMQFDHLSFNLPDENALDELRNRLKGYGCEVTDVVDHGFIHSIYFNDPNGIALEASWWVVDPTGGSPITPIRSCSPTRTRCPRSGSCRAVAGWRRSRTRRWRATR